MSASGSSAAPPPPAHGGRSAQVSRRAIWPVNRGLKKGGPARLFMVRPDDRPLARGLRTRVLAPTEGAPSRSAATRWRPKMAQEAFVRAHRGGLPEGPPVELRAGCLG